MKKKRLHILAALVASSLFLSGCADHQDVAFARRVMQQLVEGRYAARHAIAWSSLKMMNTDVGAQYRQLRDAKEREDYQRSFIQSFSQGFRYSKAGFKKTFRNWRIHEKKPFLEEGQLTVVAADTADQSRLFLFCIGREDGKRKLFELWAIILDQDQAGPVQGLEEVTEEANDVKADAP